MLRSGKYVYIDSYRLRITYQKFKDAQSVFNQEVEQWNAEIEDEKNRIERMESEFESQSLLLSDSEQRARAQSIVQRKTAWQNLTQEIFGPNGRAEQRNTELTKPLLEEINQALEKLARKNGYAMVLDCVNGNIAYATKDLDITDAILEELEKPK